MFYLFNPLNKTERIGENVTLVSATPEFMQAFQSNARNIIGAVKFPDITPGYVFSPIGVSNLYRDPQTIKAILSAGKYSAYLKGSAVYYVVGTLHIGMDPIAKIAPPQNNESFYGVAFTFPAILLPSRELRERDGRINYGSFSARTNVLANQQFSPVDIFKGIGEYASWLNLPIANPVETGKFRHEANYFADGFIPKQNTQIPSMLGKTVPTSFSREDMRHFFDGDTDMQLPEDIRNLSAI